MSEKETKLKSYPWYRAAEGEAYKGVARLVKPKAETTDTDTKPEKFGTVWRASKWAPALLVCFLVGIGYCDTTIFDTKLTIQQYMGKTTTMQLPSNTTYVVTVVGDKDATEVGVQVFYDPGNMQFERVGVVVVDRPTTKVVSFKTQVAGKYHIMVKNKGGLATFNLSVGAK